MNTMGGSDLGEFGRDLRGVPDLTCLRVRHGTGDRNRMGSFNESLNKAIMKKLILQMQITMDGYSAGVSGQLDWMTPRWSKDLEAHVQALTDRVDRILMGRKMTHGFITYWNEVLSRPDDPEYGFAQKMMNYPKIVFTRTLGDSPWQNTSLAKGSLTEEVNRLKAEKGKDLIAYGGVSFAAALIARDLIDEYHLFMNAVAIGSGMNCFDQLSGPKHFQVDSVRKFDNGIVGLVYKPLKT